MKQNFYAAVNKNRCQTPTRNPIIQDQSSDSNNKLTRAQVPNYLVQTR